MTKGHGPVLTNGRSVGVPAEEYVSRTLCIGPRPCVYFLVNSNDVRVKGGTLEQGPEGYGGRVIPPRAESLICPHCYAQNGVFPPRTAAGQRRPTL